MNIKITFPVQVPPPGIRIVNAMGYGYPPIVTHFDLTTAITNDNYNHYDYVAVENSTGYMEVTGRGRPFTLNQSDIDYLAAIQPSDYSLRAKMNWFIGEEMKSGRPMWRDGSNYRFDCCFFGHNPVRIIEKSKITRIFKFPSGIVEEGDFYKVDGFRRSMMSRPLAELLREGYIQIANEAIGTASGPDNISYIERGIKYIPVYDPDEFQPIKGWQYYVWGGGLLL